jgi:Tfp pilus assembly protein PilO
MRTLQTQADWCARAQWVLALSLGLLVLGFYAVAYHPNSQKLESLKTQIDTQRRDLLANRSRARILPDVLMAVNETRTRLERFDKKLPRQPDLSSFMNDISEVSHQASLRKVEVKPGAPARSELYTEWPIALTFEGEFNSVFAFLRRAEEMQRLTRVKGLKVRNTEPWRSGQVQVELSMNIYFSEGAYAP